MKIRQGFVSNSSSSSFIIHLNKSIEQHTMEEFKSFLELDKLQFHDANVDKGVEQLFNALLNGKQTELEKYKCPNTYQIVMGDLCDMEDVEEAYALTKDYPIGMFDEGNHILIANNNLVLIDLGVDIG